MPATRAQVVAAARSWLGTRWHHQGRVKGAGVDCAGLVIGVARELGIADVDFANYSRFPVGRTLRDVCGLYMTRINPEDVQPGDVLLMAFVTEPQHLAIVAEFDGRPTIIHAFADARGVVENDLAEPWISRIRGAYRMPGIE
jgi:NlpC/P60 family putative phage cell wall peptidase